MNAVKFPVSFKTAKTTRNDAEAQMARAVTRSEDEHSQSRQSIRARIRIRGISLMFPEPWLQPTMWQWSLKQIHVPQIVDHGLGIRERRLIVEPSKRGRHPLHTSFKPKSRYQRSFTPYLGVVMVFIAILRALTFQEAFACMTGPHCANL